MGGRSGSSSHRVTSGRARSGCAAWSSSRRTSRGSGSATATTTTRTTGRNSATASELGSDAPTEGQKKGEIVKRFSIVAVLAAGLIAVGLAGASTPGADVRLTNDCHPAGGWGAGYVSAYTLPTGAPYTHQTPAECSTAPRPPNEPAGQS